MTRAIQFRGAPLAAATVLALSAGLSDARAAGETVTVNTVEDVVDFSGAQQVTDLPGPDGKVSFREAIAAANNTAGPQTIAFAVPTSEWWLYNDRAMLKLEQSAFVVTGDGTTFDFTTQTGFTGNTNPNGWEVGIYGLAPNGWGVAALIITADDCTITGLDRVMQRGYAASIAGNNNRVINCTISGPIHAAIEIGGWFGSPPATGNVIGGTLPEERNVLSGGGSGVRIAAPAEYNVVIGNEITGGDIGVWVLGSIYSTTVNYNRIGGPTPQERNIIAGAGSYCCEGAPDGGQVMLEYGLGNIIEGNYIGTTGDGSAGAGQAGPYGVRLLHSSGTIVRDNVIGDIVADGFSHYAGQRFGVGVSILGNSHDNVIQGNRIGVAANGVTALPNHLGIEVSSFGPDVPANNLIGGTGPGQGNVVAANELEGIRVGYAVSGVTIRGNSIVGNVALGIDLLSPFAGPTPNDPGDADTGANGLQNFPVLTAASESGGTVTIEGNLDGTASSTFDLDFFAGAACDGSGFGEGEAYLGSAAVTTDPAGLADFTVTLPGAIESGGVVTATATALSTGNTSEFSECLAVETGFAAGDVDRDGVVGVNDFLAVLAAWGPCAGGCGNCPADCTGDCVVGVDDFLMVLANWGS